MLAHFAHGIVSAARARQSRSTLGCWLLAFCWIGQSKWTEFNDDLKEAVREVLTKYIHCNKTDEGKATDPHATDARSFARELLYACHVDSNMVEY